MMRPQQTVPEGGASASGAAFKRCPLCRFTWETRDAFLSDPGLQLIGYQVTFKRLSMGLFLFNHTCKGTLAVKAADFRDLYQGPVFEVPLTGSAACPEHCLHTDDLQPCPAPCECAYVREVIQAVRKWPKASNSASAALKGDVYATDRTDDRSGARSD